MPGCRVPITIAAGTFGVSYRVFAASVAFSTAIWAGCWLVVGSLAGWRVARFLGHHHALYGVLAALLAVAVVLVAVQVGRELRHADRR